MKYVVLLLIQNNTFLRLGVQNILICQKWCWEIGQTVESKDQFLSGTYMDLQGMSVSVLQGQPPVLDYVWVFEKICIPLLGLEPRFYIKHSTYLSL